jgi:hypothetical protein
LLKQVFFWVRLSGLFARRRDSAPERKGVITRVSLSMTFFSTVPDSDLAVVGNNRENSWR